MRRRSSAEGSEPRLQDLLILCYHAVSPSWSSFLAVRPQRLRQQVELLLGRGYRPSTLSAALAAGEGRRLVVSFDDGYRSILARGLPVLAELGVPATAFIQTDLADAGGRFAALPEAEMPADPEELDCMSWGEVRELADAGWEIGSHTRSHPHLERIPAAAATEELEASRRRCEEELQRQCRTIAYPFGTYNRAVMEMTERAGYAAAVTLESRMFEPIAGRTRFDLPREGVFHETGLPKFRANVSPLIRRIRLAPAYARLARGRLASSHG